MSMLISRFGKDCAYAIIESDPYDDDISAELLDTRDAVNEFLEKTESKCYVVVIEPDPTSQHGFKVSLEPHT